ncbi:MAG: acyl-CoA dehydrogenase family protein [Beijerinckiaceae bacterium]
MRDESFLHWPFFDEAHRNLARDLDGSAAVQCVHVQHDDVDAACRALVKALGSAGWLKHSAPDPAASDARLDVRALALIRETLARHSGLADFAFAMQGLGAGPISLFGTPEQRMQWLTRTRSGDAIAAFALSEPESGSDVANIMMRAEPRDGGYVLNGEKTWISNGGIADVYTVFARTGGPGAKGLSAFMVPADAKGFSIAERIEVIAPHPLARIRFDDCFIPAAARIGAEGQGFAIAMATLDVFRSTVGAAALGFARKALHAAATRAQSRRLYGAPMADLQMVQGHIADMALGIDAAALLIYRAAWTKDKGAARVSREAAMAKLFATEMAQKAIDAAVQIHGGEGVRSGSVVEELYRDIRALRIYEGASDVQKIIIARATLGAFA